MLLEEVFKLDLVFKTESQQGVPIKKSSSRHFLLNPFKISKVNIPGTLYDNQNCSNELKITQERLTLAE